MTLFIKRLPSHLIPIIYKTGIRVPTPSLHCLIVKSTQPLSQYAVMVGVKVHKSAVKRNRMKRIIRAACAQVLPSLPHPIQCLIVVKKDCSMKKTPDIVQELGVLKAL